VATTFVRRVFWNDVYEKARDLHLNHPDYWK
jgi:hypothetical protein